MTLGVPLRLPLRLPLLLVLLVSVCLAGAQPAAARGGPSFAGQQPAPVDRLPADSALEARTSAVAAELRCPVCQGLSIQDSPSELSQQMRDVVRDQLRDGKSPAEVRAYFVARYGEWILLRPAPKGFNLLVYAVPMLIVLGGIGMLAFILRRWTRQPAATQ